MESSSRVSGGDAAAASSAKQQVPQSTTMDHSLPLKYKKLLSEYSKLRNQVLQLTKCLTEEQKTLKAVKEECKEKDKVIKKLESEKESSDFRHTQLQKRVCVLQEELKRKSSKATAGVITPEDGESLQSTFSIFDQELTSKIKEVQTLSDQVSQLQTENSTLKEDMHELHLQNTDHEFMIRSQEEVIQSQKVMIDQLTQHHASSASSSMSQPDTTMTVKTSPPTTTVEDISHSQASQLLEKIETAGAKATLFSHECNRLRDRLNLVTDERENAKKQLRDVMEDLQSTKDQLNTCVRNYEQQLETMSEHLATMTEKWSRQQLDMESQLQEQIDISKRKTERKKSSSSKFFTDA
jgi:predicted  nucleic acid-binding Zn-ribbon protein